jgi:peptidoglycan/xylan/chitin deacetylase (PgdA/CDA1 family)
MRDSTTILMYHELEIEGRSLCQSEQGYVRYVVRENAFREQMQWLQHSGMRGLSVSEALNGKVERGIAITFDDGCETDLALAAPILRDANFGATFYITLGYLGRSGYLAATQVRELADAGFDIGCHSMTHAYLSDLQQKDLNREIVAAKKQLEDITGRPVHHFSCPGGRWTPRVAEIARQAGYHSVATSRIGANGPKTDPFQLLRIAAMRDMALPAFQDICRGRSLWQRQFRTSLQNASRQLLGNSRYDRLRSLILERRS